MLFMSGYVTGSGWSEFPGSRGVIPWWRHQMETFSALLAICAGNSLGNSPHKGQWRGALMFSLICVWIYGWVNNRVAGDLRCYYNVIVVPEIMVNPAQKQPNTEQYFEGCSASITVSNFPMYDPYYASLNQSHCIAIACINLRLLTKKYFGKHQDIFHTISNNHI